MYLPQCCKFNLVQYMVFLVPVLSTFKNYYVAIDKDCKEAGSSPVLCLKSALLSSERDDDNSRF